MLAVQIRDIVTADESGSRVMSITSPIPNEPGAAMDLCSENKDDKGSQGSRKERERTLSLSSGNHRVLEILRLEIRGRRELLDRAIRGQTFVIHTIR